MPTVVWGTYREHFCSLASQMARTRSCSSTKSGRDSLYAARSSRPLAFITRVRWLTRESSSQCTMQNAYGPSSRTFSMAT